MERVAACALCGGGALEAVPESPHVKRCGECRHVFHDPRPVVGAITDWYSRAGQYDSWLAQGAARARMWRRRTRLIRRWLPGGRVLDVGAGIGELLAALGRDFAGTGTEISAEALRVARERFGIELLHGDVHAVPQEARFDGVTLIHVLEHVADPLALLHACRARLISGGLLFCAVPNDSPLGWFKARNGGLRTLRRILAGRARGMDYEAASPFPTVDLASSAVDDELHLSHFGPDTLGQALQRAGFDVLQLGADPYRASSGARGLRDTLERRFWTLVRRLSGLHAWEALFAVARSRRP